MQLNKFNSILSVVCALTFLSSCDTLSKIQNVWVDSVDITVDRDANNDSATSIDLVFLFKKELVDEVSKLTSHDYYRRVDQLVRDNPKLIQIVRWELAPGQYLPNEKIKGVEGTPLAGIIFASYSTPGDHRVILGLQRNLDIHLMANDFFVSEKLK